MDSQKKLGATALQAAEPPYSNNNGPLNETSIKCYSTNIVISDVITQN